MGILKCRLRLGESFILEKMGHGAAQGQVCFRESVRPFKAPDQEPVGCPGADTSNTGQFLNDLMGALRFRVLVGSRREGQLSMSMLGYIGFWTWNSPRRGRSRFAAR